MINTDNIRQVLRGRIVEICERDCNELENSASVKNLAEALRVIEETEIFMKNSQQVEFLEWRPWWSRKRSP